MPRSSDMARSIEKNPSLPRLVILDENFGFMDGNSLRQWKDGDIVTDGPTIATLIARNAPLKELSHV